MNCDWDNWADETVREALIIQTLKLMLKERNTDRVPEDELIARVVEVLNGMDK
jgi:hypothetical protein